MSALGFHVMAKPMGPVCNLECKYCFYLEKNHLFPKGELFRMQDDVLEAYIQKYICEQDLPEISFVWQGGEPTLAGIPFFEKILEMCIRDSVKTVRRRSFAIRSRARAYAGPKASSAITLRYRAKWPTRQSLQCKRRGDKMSVILSKTNAPCATSMARAYFEFLRDGMKENEKLMHVEADLGLSLLKLDSAYIMDKYPFQYVDIGIQEANAVCVGAGLSAMGCIPSVSYTHLDVYKRQKSF